MKSRYIFIKRENEIIIITITVVRKLISFNWIGSFPHLSDQLINRLAF